MYFIILIVLLSGCQVIPCETPTEIKTDLLRSHLKSIAKSTTRTERQKISDISESALRQFKGTYEKLCRTNSLLEEERLENQNKQSTITQLNSEITQLNDDLNLLNTKIENLSKELKSKSNAQKIILFTTAVGMSLWLFINFSPSFI